MKSKKLKSPKTVPLPLYRIVMRRSIFQQQERIAVERSTDGGKSRDWTELYHDSIYGAEHEIEKRKANDTGEKQNKSPKILWSEAPNNKSITL